MAHVVLRRQTAFHRFKKFLRSQQTFLSENQLIFSQKLQSKIAQHREASTSRYCCSHRSLKKRTLKFNEDRLLSSFFAVSMCCSLLGRRRGIEAISGLGVCRLKYSPFISLLHLVLQSASFCTKRCRWAFNFKHLNSLDS